MCARPASSSVRVRCMISAIGSPLPGVVRVEIILAKHHLLVPSALRRHVGWAVLRPSVLDASGHIPPHGAGPRSGQDVRAAAERTARGLGFVSPLPLFPSSAIMT